MAKAQKTYHSMKRLSKKGCNIMIPLLDQEAWGKLIEKDPLIPRSFSQLKLIGAKIFNRKYRKQLRDRHWDIQPHRGLLTHGVEECGEAAYYQYYTGLSNPWLSNAQRDEVEADIDADMPVFENSIETDHFILRWTNASANAVDNIADSGIITDTGNYLETAWDTYRTTFGRDPYVAPGATKIEVVFHDIAGLGLASPPEGPIQFDAWNWVNDPGIRQPTSAHELFHKLQYAFGYRTTWAPAFPYKWFSEGTASWAEVFVWQRVSRAYKILNLFSNPDINLYDASYRALPFWIFFQARQQDSPIDNPMVSFLQKYELSGDEEQALEQAVGDEWASNNVHRELAHFFALFSRERTRNAWKTGPSGALYQDILGPDDNPIAPALLRTEVPMGLGDSYIDAGTVSQLGSDYYRFSFNADADGATFAFSGEGAPAGDYSYYLVWEKAGAFVRGVFPFMVIEDYSFSEAINLDFADSVTVVISGRGVGGTYNLNASIS